MPGTGLGIIWIDMLCRPLLKFLMKCPILALLVLILVYGYIAYNCLKSAYQYAD